MKHYTLNVAYREQYVECNLFLYDRRPTSATMFVEIFRPQRYSGRATFLDSKWTVHVHPLPIMGEQLNLNTSKAIIIEKLPQEIIDQLDQILNGRDFVEFAKRHLRLKYDSIPS